LAGRDAAVADLLDQFVCVRLVQANGADLALFQFDYLLTMATVFLNADGTVYGRYGSVSAGRKYDQVTLAGFAKALEAALEIHKGYPANKDALRGKKGPAPRFPRPEGYPMLKGYPAKVDTTNAGKAETSCLHCHEIEKAEFKIYRAARQPIPEETLWRFPTPEVVGLSLDPDQRATVKAVAAGSPAEKAGFKAGDEIAALDGQPLVSIADVVWILQQAKDGASLKAEVRRGGAAQTLTLALPKGWRRKGALDHRAGPWVYRPISDAQDLDAAERKKLGLADSAIAILITWPDFGLLKGDVIVEVDGRRSGLTLNEFLAYVGQKKMPGDKIDVAVLRGGKPIKLQLTAR
jgi:hypothetical protein